MPLTERDPNVNGRSSRASNVSAGSRGPIGPRSDFLSNAPGVMSMLKTSTELGDLSLPPSRKSNTQRPAPRRSRPSSRLSTGSARSQPMKRTSNHQQWPSSSSIHRRSLTSTITAPTYTSEALTAAISTVPLANPRSSQPRLSREMRSYSLTTTSQSPYVLAKQRSFASLRSQDHTPRPRSPFRYPTRLKRPGYRPCSPALNDIVIIPSGNGQGHGHGPRLRAPSLSQSLSGEQGRPPLQARQRSAPSISSAASEPMRTKSFERLPGMYTHQKASSSSVATSRRTFATAYSTDPSSSSTPSTPKESSSLEVILTPTVAGLVLPSVETSSSSSPMYYDYSEHFHAHVQMEEPKSDDSPAPLGFVHRIRTILEERAVVENRVDKQPTEAAVERSMPQDANAGTVGMSEDAEEPSPETIQLPDSPLADCPTTPVAELPGSPVLKRITREVILSALQPAGETTLFTVEVQPPTTTTIEVPQSASTEDRVASPVAENLHTHKRSNSPALSTHSNNKLSNSLIDTSFRSTPSVSTIRTGGQRSEYAEATPRDTKKQEQQDRLTPNFNHSPSKANAAAPTTFFAPDRIRQMSLVRRPYSDTTLTSSKLEHKLNFSSPSLGHLPSASNNNELPSAEEVLKDKNALNVDGLAKTKGILKADNLPKASNKFSKANKRLEVNDLPQSQEDTILRRVSNITDGPKAHDKAKAKDIPKAKDALKTKATLKVNANAPARFSVARFLGIQPRKSSLNVTATATEPLNAKRERTSTPTPSSTEFQSPISPFETPDPGSSTAPTTAVDSTPDIRGQRDSITITHLVWPGHKSFAGPRQVPERITSLQRNSQDESTTDLRLSQFQYPQTSLSDVREEQEPHEESSVVASRPASFRFPRRPSSSRVPSKDGLRLIKHPSVRSSFRRPGQLSEACGLPSMNFSRTDLISKLNEALELEHRSTLSLDGSRLDWRTSFPPASERPFSAGDMREKYRSFFAHLDELEKPSPVASEPTLPRPATSMDVVAIKRPYSPDELLTELNRLSIPNVAALTHRLSELLPSLRRFGTDDEELAEDDTLTPALKEIHDVGEELLHPKHSSARLRPVPGRAELVIVDDDVYEEMTHKDILLEDTLEKEAVESPETTAESSRKSIESIKSASSQKSSPIALLKTPEPAVLRKRSMTTGHRSMSESNVRASRLARPSLQSLRTSPPESRPWNLDKNYPWADAVPSIDISLPAQAHIRDTTRLGPSRLRLRLSGSSQDDSHSVTSVTSAMLDSSGDDPFNHKRRTSRKSIIGTMSRRMGINSSYDAEFGPGPEIVEAHDERPLGSGERYPTTGLTPPSTFNLEDVRSFFSDDSSEAHRGASFRKRLTHLKAKLPPVSRAHSALENRSMGKTSVQESNIGNGGSVHTYNGTIGMSKMEYRAKRIVEKIKSFWCKSGELLRSMSARHKPKPESQNLEWLQDTDMYSAT